MARKRRKEVKLIKYQSPKKKEKPKLIEFEKALRTFRKRNPSKSKYLMDLEVVKAYAIKFFPNLIAEQEDWNDIFLKF